MARNAPNRIVATVGFPAALLNNPSFSVRAVVLSNAPRPMALPRRGASADEELRSLRRTQEKLVQEVAKVSDTIGELLASDDVLRAVGSELSGVNAEIAAGERLAKQLARKERFERWLLSASWLLFFAVVAHVWATRLLGISVLHMMLQIAASAIPG